MGCCPTRNKLSASRIGRKINQILTIVIQQIMALVPDEEKIHLFKEVFSTDK